MAVIVQGTVKKGVTRWAVMEHAFNFKQRPELSEFEASLGL